MGNASLLLIVAVSYSFQSLFCKLFSDNYKGNSNSSPLIFSTIIGTFIAIASFALAGFGFAPSKTTLLLGIFNALISFFYNISFMKATSTGSYAFSIICGVFGGITIPVAFSHVFLDEKVSAFQVVAIVIMLISFVIINIKGLNLKGSTASYYFWCFALFTTNGIFSTLIKYQQEVMEGTQRSEMLVLTYGGTAVFAFASLLFTRKKSTFVDFNAGQKALIFVIVCGVCSTLATNLNLFMTTRLPVAVLFTINNGGVLVLSTLYAFTIFKEKAFPSQIIGIFMALASIVMLAI